MNLHWYWMINPPRGGFRDTNNPAFTQKVAGPNGESLDASLFIDDSGQPLFVRVRAFDTAGLNDGERFISIVDLAKEHMLTVLRVTWQHDSSFVPASFFMQEPIEGSEAAVQVDWPSSFDFNAVEAHALYQHTIQERESLRLLTDGTGDALPLQYRFLSLYKFLELRFRGDDDKWDFNALSIACEPQLAAFAELGLGRTFHAELQHLRDRCAHVRTGSGKKRRLGVTALNSAAAKEVDRVLPLLVNICQAVLNSELAGKVEFRDLRPWYRRVERAQQGG